MKREDRLFRILELLRPGKLWTAARLAKELDVSERTIYRDVRDLVRCGVPIEGEAGVGYALPHGVGLPPLFFDEEELQALVLGARMVEAYGDAPLARRARDVVAKVAGALPRRQRHTLDSIQLFAPGELVPPELTRHLEPLRRALLERRPVRFRYTRRDGEPSRRRVRPLGLFFWGRSWTLAAWCELREDFRIFRPDRMEELVLERTPFEPEEGRDLATFVRRMTEGEA